MGREVNIRGVKSNRGLTQLAIQLAMCNCRRGRKKKKEDGAEREATMAKRRRIIGQ